MDTAGKSREGERERSKLVGFIDRGTGERHFVRLAR